MHKNKIFTFGIFLILVVMLLSFTSAGWFSNFFGKLTGNSVGIDVGTSYCNSVTCVLYGGEEVIFSKNFVSMNFINSDSVVLDINGVSTKSLSRGEVYSGNGFDIVLNEIVYTPGETRQFVIFDYELKESSSQEKISSQDEFYGAKEDSADKVILDGQNAYNLKAKIQEKKQAFQDRLDDSSEKAQGLVWNEKDYCEEYGDKGYDPYVASIASIYPDPTGQYKYKEHCISLSSSTGEGPINTGSLVEYNCEGLNLKKTIVHCENGCGEGACLRELSNVTCDGKGLDTTYTHTCVLKDNGNVECYGNNKWGQSENYMGGDAVQVSVGFQHTCVLKNNGNVYCYGSNDFGQANDYAGGDAIQVDAARYHTCIVENNGNVKCWGEDVGGQIVNYNEGDAIQVAVENYETCILKKNGDIECSGVTTPNGYMDSYSIPGAVGIDVENYHLCVLLNNGNVECYGNNNGGQSENYIGRDAKEISTGYRHTCILKNNGDVYCYGQDSYGEIEDYNGGDAVAVSAGFQNTCILKNDGEVSCYGNNDSGQSGDYICEGGQGSSSSSGNLNSGEKLSFAEKIKNFFRFSRKVNSAQ